MTRLHSLRYAVLRLAASIALALAATGCASWRSASVAQANEPASQVQTCTDWYTRLDSAIDTAGVRDASAVPIAGFAYLRVDRFSAALGQAMRNDQGSDMAARQTALLQRLAQLDLHARALETANLPASVRNALNTSLNTTLLEHTQGCASVLTAYAAASPQDLSVLLQSLQVPDDYVTAYRMAGLYALTRYPFAAGVRKLEAQRSSVFAQDAAPQAGSQRTRYTPPVPPSLLSPSQIRRALQPAQSDPLQIPAPSPSDLAQLLAQFAPNFDIDIATDDDKPGALVWPSPSAASGAPRVDTHTPVLYHHTAYTRYNGHNLLQLVYTLWFPARPPEPGSSFDLLAGHLDGVVWRVTLAPDGTPLVYDSIHPCGCYHMFFTSPSAQPKPAPQAGIEWAFVPQSLPALAPHESIVVRIAPLTHYIDRISVEPTGTSADRTLLALRDYDSLRALPLTSMLESRSVFSPQGFIDGTDRAERFIFWPMGIARAGSMRQWGKQATAFIGRRHFDDALLLQERFTFDPKHFKSTAP
jgi:hypothetical protein